MDLTSSEIKTVREVECVACSGRGEQGFLECKLCDGDGKRYIANVRPGDARLINP